MENITNTIDLNLFSPDLRDDPILRLVYVGLISTRSSILEFLDLPNDLGQKFVIGLGPDRDHLIVDYPNVTFVDAFSDHILARQLANADVVIPQVSYVIHMANACGTPVATTEHSTLIVDHLNGVVDDDLEIAVINAATLDRNKIREYMEKLS